MMNQPRQERRDAEGTLRREFLPNRHLHQSASHLSGLAYQPSRLRSHEAALIQHGARRPAPSGAAHCNHSGFIPAAVTDGHLQGSGLPAQVPDLRCREFPTRSNSRGRSIGRETAGDNITGTGASAEGDGVSPSSSATAADALTDTGCCTEVDGGRGCTTTDAVLSQKSGRRPIGDFDDRP
jgi:hypothetical protein